MFGWFTTTAPSAQERIMASAVRSGLNVKGHLQFIDVELPHGLPRNLKVDALTLSRVRGLKSLPGGLTCRRLRVSDPFLEWLPPDLRVAELADLSGCVRFHLLPLGFAVPTLVLRDCTALKELPDSLRVTNLDIRGCSQLDRLPAGLGETLTHLDASGCRQLQAIPDTYSRLVELNVSDCPELTNIPGGVQIRSWIDVAGSGLRGLPQSLRSTRVLWNGVQIPDRIAFDPESISADEVLIEQNQEVRRIMLARMGMDRFMRESLAESLDVDRDPGGERRLLRVRMNAGEDIVCVAVRCPSTGNQYMLRVPPAMTSCRQAIAWTAGFDDAELYQPIRET